MAQFEKKRKLDIEGQAEFSLRQLLTAMQDQEFIMSLPVETGGESDERKETI